MKIPDTSHNTYIFPSSEILHWYSIHQRPLPWRAPDTAPWAVMVSEFMLQQTPVSRVLPVWSHWIIRWPTPKDLADEPVAEAIKEWDRLGYPRRAMRLHQAAVLITEQYHGIIPHSINELRSLPGIGEYTAHAIANFAYGQHVPVVDVNVRRVIHRVVNGYDPHKPSQRDWHLFERITTQCPQQKLSAAVMEFGALCCTARNPLCDQCPIRKNCTWLAHDKPVLSVKKPVQKYLGTDRYVRGLLLDLLRKHTASKEQLDNLWPDTDQRERALNSLIADGLVSANNGYYLLGS